MGDRFLDLLLRLTARERWLLALLAGVVVPAGLWFGALQPLQTRHMAARAAHDETRALGLWLVERAGEQARLAPIAPRPQSAPIGTSGLEQSLIDAGLRPQVSELSAQPGGGIRLRFDVVQFTRLGAWLSDAEPEWGYAITAMRLEPAQTSGAVAADLTLAPQK